MLNYQNVLRVYKLERELTLDDVALLNTLREMPETVREMFAETLGLPVKAKAAVKQRKVEHCVACDRTGRAAVHKDASLSDYHEFQSSKPKSARAASLAEQIKTTSRPLDGGVSQMRCTKENCGEYADHNIHHLESVDGYHEFQSSQTVAVGGRGI